MIAAVLVSALLTAQPAPEARLQLAAYRGRGSMLAPAPRHKPRVESSLRPPKPKGLYPKSRPKCALACRKRGTGTRSPPKY
jgi:hypothetical protein